MQTTFKELVSRIREKAEISFLLSKEFEHYREIFTGVALGKGWKLHVPHTLPQQVQDVLDLQYDYAEYWRTMTSQERMEFVDQYQRAVVKALL